MTYTPCAGTGQPATAIRLMSSDSPRFFHLNGKNAGRCPECDRSFTLGRAVIVTPRHKGVAA